MFWSATAHDFWPFTVSTAIEQTYTIAVQLEQLSEMVIKPVIRRKLHISLDAADTSVRNLDGLELVSAVQIALLGASERVSDGDSTILDLNGFVARVTANACYQYFRSKFPVRSQTENKIRYLIKHEPRFELWKGQGGRWLAGLSQFAGQDVANPLHLAEHDIPAGATHRSEREDWTAILDSAFRFANGPVTLAALIAFAMRVRNLHEPSAARSGDQSNDIDVIPERGARVDHSLEIRSRLGQVWQCILKLPTSDRVVLLLNLKDDAGDSLLPVFVSSGVTSVHRIAESLDKSAEQLAAVWNSLPWDDNTIAEQTRQTRQQVINRRYGARRRLAALVNGQK